MIKHKTEAIYRPERQKLYPFMNEIGIEKFEILEIEKFPCDSKEELRKREGHYIKEMGTLNTLIAGRTNKEYKEETKN